MKAYWAILLFCLSIYSAHTVAQNTKPTKRAYPQTVRGIASESGECMIPRENAIHIPDVAEDDPPQSYTFYVKNHCDRTIRITEVINSCSCLTTQISDSIFGPGEEKEIILTFNPYRKSGDIFQEAFIYTDTHDDDADFSLQIIGKIKPSADPYYHFTRKVGVLRFKRKFMTFKYTEDNQFLTERLTCVNSSDREIRISGSIKGESLPSSIKVSSDPEVIKPGQEADIVISINNEVLEKRDYSFIIALDGVDAQPADKGLMMKIDNTFKKK